MKTKAISVRTRGQRGDRSAFSRHPPAAGYTLIEVMIASCILAIALSAMMSTFILCKRGSVRMTKHLVMLHQIRQQLEEVTRHDFSDTELAIGNHALTNGHYEVSSGQFGTKDIHMEVYWADPSTPTNVWIALATSVSSGLH